MRITAYILMYIMPLFGVSAAYGSNHIIDRCDTTSLADYNPENPDDFIALWLESLSDMSEKVLPLSDLELLVYKDILSEPIKDFEEGKGMTRLEWLLMNAEFSNLQSRKRIVNFLSESIEALDFQKSASRGDVSGFLFFANTMVEKSTSDLSSDMRIVSELYQFGDNQIPSYIRNVGVPFSNSVVKHVLLCLIPRSL